MKQLKNDLLNVVIARNGSGGRVGLVGPDGDIDDFPTPITPYISVAKYVKVFDQFKFEKVNLSEMLEINKRIGSQFTAAYCLQDRPTCGSNPGISPVANFGERYNFADVMELRKELEVTINHIDRYADKVFSRTRKQRDDLIPAMERGLESLK